MKFAVAAVAAVLSHSHLRDGGEVRRPRRRSSAATRTKAALAEDILADPNDAAHIPADAIATLVSPPTAMCRRTRGRPF